MGFGQPDRRRRRLQGNDEITISADHICSTNACGANQQIEYVAPATDGEVLRIIVKTNDGDDTINVESTARTVPVRVEAGNGNDVVKVGTGSLNSIVGQSRPGLNAPFGLGPLVIVGGQTNGAASTATSRATTRSSSTTAPTRPQAPAPTPAA